jgi:hypothetical protein
MMCILVLDTISLVMGIISLVLGNISLVLAGLELGVVWSLGYVGCH